MTVPRAEDRQRQLLQREHLAIGSLRKLRKGTASRRRSWKRATSETTCGAKHCPPGLALALHWCSGSSGRCGKAGWSAAQRTTRGACPKSAALCRPAARGLAAAQNVAPTRVRGTDGPPGQGKEASKVPERAFPDVAAEGRVVPPEEENTGRTARGPARCRSPTLTVTRNDRQAAPP